MANLEYAFASSGTAVSFPIGDSGITGIDEAGTITSKVVKLGANVHLLLTATKTDAELVALMTSFKQRFGAGHEGAGGFPAQATVQAAVVTTTVSAAD